MHDISNDSLVHAICFLNPIDFQHIRVTCKRFLDVTNASNTIIQHYWKHQCIHICHDVTLAIQSNNYNCQNWFHLYKDIVSLVIDNPTSKRFFATDVVTGSGPMCLRWMKMTYDFTDYFPAYLCGENPHNVNVYSLGKDKEKGISMVQEYWQTTKWAIRHDKRDLFKMLMNSVIINQDVNFVQNNGMEIFGTEKHSVLSYASFLNTAVRYNRLDIAKYLLSFDDLWLYVKNPDTDHRNHRSHVIGTDINGYISEWIEKPKDTIEIIELAVKHPNFDHDKFVQCKVCVRHFLFNQSFKYKVCIL